MELLKEDSVSPVIGVVVLVAVVVLLAALTLATLSGSDSQEGSTSGVKVDGNQISLTDLGENSERVIIQRRDGEVYYMNNVGEVVNAKPGTYSIISQAPDGEKTVVKSGVEISNSVIVDNFNNNKATTTAASNSFENNVKLINLKSGKLVDGRYVSGVVGELPGVDRVKVVTGDDNTAKFSVRVYTNLEYDNGGFLESNVKGDTYAAKGITGSSTRNVKKERKTSIPQAQFSSSFLNNLKSGGYKNGIIVSVTKPVDTTGKIDIEKIEIIGNDGESFDAKRNIDGELLENTYKITSAPSKVDSGKTMSITVKMNAGKNGINGKYGILHSETNGDRLDAKKDISISPGSSKKVTFSFTAPKFLGDQKKQFEFASLTVDNSGLVPQIKDKEVKDTTFIKIQQNQDGPTLLP